jgi:hypothetical protein
MRHLEPKVCLRQQEMSWGVRPLAAWQSARVKTYALSRLTPREGGLDAFVQCRPVERFCQEANRADEIIQQSEVPAADSARARVGRADLDEKGKDDANNRWAFNKRRYLVECSLRA